MKRQIAKRPKGRIDPARDVLTKERFKPLFEDIKDLIQSSAKGTQAVLMRAMDKKFEVTWAAISEHSKMIKGLDKKIDGVRTELKEEMHQMERRLSDKIGGHSARLDDHESRIAGLERCA